MAWPRRFGLALIAIVAVSPIAHAHDLWLVPVFEPSGARIAVNYGHPGDRSPPAVDKTLPQSLRTARPRSATDFRQRCATEPRSSLPVRS